jgi:cytidyltransferase-like protein
MEKIVLVTGGFDPLHSGHIAYFKAAKAFGSKLVVGINSNEWLIRKKSRAFMDWSERAEIIRNLSMVDEVIAFDDSDGSASDAILQLATKHPEATIVFANGGDRHASNIPVAEQRVLGKLTNVAWEFGVGGIDKMNSSSWILAEWKSPKTERQWGYYRVLHDVKGCKVKELTVDPGKSLSMQRHKMRHEYWLVSEGACVVNSMLEGGYKMPAKTLEIHDEFKVPMNTWHQLTNPFDVPCKIVEIQYGDDCIEEDIERK